ncbi:MAG: hypothetical protein V5783_05675 [Pontiella sp.]
MNYFLSALTRGVILMGSLEVSAGNPLLKKGEKGFIYTPDPAEVFDGKVDVDCSRAVERARSFSTLLDYSVLESSDLKNGIRLGGF